MADGAGAAEPCPARSRFGPSGAGARRGRTPTAAGRDGCSAPTDNPKRLPPLSGRYRGGTMAMERSELERRRDELTRSLPGLSEDQAYAYRRNSDALALD